MENKILAIKGHSTRGNEVIKILKMLGGQNISDIKGNGSYLYYIDGNNFISMTSQYQTNFIIFTLEQFLKNFPYKVGDKVKTIRGKIGNISECIWSVDNCVKYKLETDDFIYYRSQELIPYKEEIKAEDRLKIYADTAIDNDSKTDIIINGERLIAPNGYTVKTATLDGNNLIVEYVKNKPQYPKTYEECCQITKKVAKTTHELDIAYNPNLIYDFQKLLICRDAYWKIEGEEMGLSEPWKPSANDEGKTHALYYNRYTDSIDKCEGLFESNAILDFPTKEMRDAFFENFKDLIEGCKEFL